MLLLVSINPKFSNVGPPNKMIVAAARADSHSPPPFLLAICANGGDSEPKQLRQWMLHCMEPVAENCQGLTELRKGWCPPVTAVFVDANARTFRPELFLTYRWS